MRTRYCAATLFTFLGACSFFPDFEHTPSARLPVAEVINQIRCDMFEFLSTMDRGPDLGLNEPGGRTFSLDEESYATVELLLSTTAFGDVKFSKIDTLRIDAKGWLAVGSSSQPFPSLGVKQTNQVTTKVVVNISQKASDLKAKCEGGRHYGYAQILSNKPEADRILINDLRLASWLMRTFDSGDRIAGNPNAKFCNARSVGKTPKKEEETCSVGLETATLTTKFQIVGDVSGGMLDFAKLIPVVATPTLQLNADYYHQIQIIFQGNNVINQDAPARTFGERQRIVDRGVSLLSKRLYKFECPPDSQSDICKALRKKVERTTPPPSAVSDDARALARQLRSIRDALILNNTRP